MKRFISAAVLSALAGSAAAASEGMNPALEQTLEFVARASSTSEVLTLNLTNLLILLVLKAIIFGFGLFTVGGAGRSVDSTSRAITETDISGGMCFLMYTSGAEDKLDCVKRAACEDPYLAADYYTASKMWYNMHKLMKS